MKLGVLAVGMLFLFGCGKDSKVPDQKDCVVLDSLFTHTDSLEKLLENTPESWNAVNEVLDVTLHLMARNQQESGEGCSYLDHRNKPEKERFLFVELLSEAAINDTFPEIIRYLVRLRGLFGEDPEIFEYLSEEMAHVGFANPQAYVRYLQHYPEQKELILHSTRWNPVNVPKLRQKFEPVPGGAEVAEFLSLRFPANSTPKQK